MRTRRRPGQTLIEVTIAALIAAVTTTAIFSVILSSFVADSKADKRDAAAMALKRAQETLKSYVSADPTSEDLFAAGPSAPAAERMNGAPGNPPGHWDADTNPGWALALGDHNISRLVEGPPLSVPGAPAQFTYRVFNRNCLSTLIAAPTTFNQCKQVEFLLTYTD